jgi:hypothetical protein
MTDRHAWRPLLFECPRTGSKVQAIIHEDAARFDDTSYETVSCPACASTHFVNALTGMVLGAPRNKIQ